MTLKPPKAKKINHWKTVHGVRWNDPYDWLYDRAYPKVKDKAVVDYLKAENAYTEAFMRPYKKLIKTIFREMKGRIPEEDEGVPAKDGPYLYSWRFAKGTQYRIWTRKPVGGGPEEILLDENHRAKGLDYYRLGALALSEDHKTLAFAEDLSGAERYTIRFKDLQTGKLTGAKIPDTIGGPVWSADGRYLFYTVLDANWRPCEIRRHKFGTKTEDDVLIYREKDPGFFLSVGKTHSREFIVIQAGDQVTSEVRVFPAESDGSRLTLVSRRRRNHYYGLDHARGRFYIRTNDHGVNFRVASAPDHAPQEKNWREEIPHRESDYIRGFIAFKEYLAIQQGSRGLDQIRIRHYGGGDHIIDFPEPVAAIGLDNNPEFDSPYLRLHYESMITPTTIFDYDVKTRKLKTRKVQKIPSGHDKKAYATERLMAKGRDGAEIPVTLLYKKGLKKDGKNPLHLYGYGAYGHGLPPHFNTNAFSLVDRGFVYALAHVRGGDEMGFQWYLDGKLEKRQNTFNDFIDAAQFLIAKKYTGVGRISIEGRSAGGELMGAVINQAPELWRAALLGVPFVDALNTMLNKDLPLTPPEWPEWGNPIKDKKAFGLIRAYSPYDNIGPKDYPAQYVSGGLNDPRVTYWEPAKWTAKMRDLKTDDNPVLLKINMGAGHGGKSGRFTHLEERAEEFAFILARFGLAK